MEIVPDSCLANSQGPRLYAGSEIDLEELAPGAFSTSSLAQAGVIHGPDANFVRAALSGLDFNDMLSAFAGQSEPDRGALGRIVEDFVNGSISSKYHPVLARVRAGLLKLGELSGVELLIPYEKRLRCYTADLAAEKFRAKLESYFDPQRFDEQAVVQRRKLIDSLCRVSQFWVELFGSKNIDFEFRLLRERDSASAGFHSDQGVVLDWDLLGSGPRFVLSGINWLKWRNNEQKHEAFFTSGARVVCDLQPGQMAFFKEYVLHAVLQNREHGEKWRAAALWRAQDENVLLTRSPGRVRSAFEDLERDLRKISAPG